MSSAMAKADSFFPQKYFLSSPKYSCTVIFFFQSRCTRTLTFTNSCLVQCLFFFVLLRGGEGKGIFVHDKGRGSFVSNDIAGNGAGGVSVATGGDPLLRRNKVTDNLICVCVCVSARAPHVCVCVCVCVCLCVCVCVSYVYVYMYIFAATRYICGCTRTFAPLLCETHLQGKSTSKMNSRANLLEH